MLQSTTQSLQSWLSAIKKKTYSGCYMCRRSPWIAKQHHSCCLWSKKTSLNGNSCSTSNSLAHRNGKREECKTFWAAPFSTALNKMGTSLCHIEFPKGQSWDPFRLTFTWKSGHFNCNSIILSYVNYFKVQWHQKASTWCKQTQKLSTICKTFSVKKRPRMWNP